MRHSDNPEKQAVSDFPTPTRGRVVSSKKNWFQHIQKITGLSRNIFLLLSFGFVVLAFGMLASLILVKQSQDARNQAWIASPYSCSSNRDCAAGKMCVAGSCKPIPTRAPTRVPTVASSPTPIPSIPPDEVGQSICGESSPGWDAVNNDGCWVTAEQQVF